MLSTFDEGLQWLVLLKVYGEEIWVLPLAAAVILITKRRNWAIPIRIILFLLLLTYVVVFRMHWHSWLAIPIMVLAITSDIARDHWYQLFGGARTLQVHAKSISQTGERQRLQRRLLLSACQIATIVTTFVYFDAPADLWVIVMGTVVLAILFGLLPGWRRLAESLFQQEVRRDPRLGRYLDWVRWTRIRSRRDRQSLLAENRITWVQKHADPSGIRLWLARCVVRQQRMMTIESAFVCGNLRRERAQAWHAFQTALYGDLAGPRQAGLQPITSISEILASDNGRATLSNWLAMTEALAECAAFANDGPGDKVGKRPQWLAASELLAHAGEVQQEIVLDLRREATQAGTMATSELQAQILEHNARSSRYFDLSACCIENHLEPGSGVPGGALDVRWRRAIGDRLAWWRPQPVQDPKVLEETLWRIVLAWRYQLLNMLSPQKSDVPKLHNVVNVFPGDIGRESSSRLFVAALARDAAESSLWLSTHQGDPSSRWSLDDQCVWADRLRQIHYWQARLRRSSLAHDEHCAMAERALLRVVHLWGLAIEQDLDVLRCGTNIWRDRLESAADLFIYEGSLRVKRLAALVERQAQVPGVILDQATELV